MRDTAFRLRSWSHGKEQREQKQLTEASAHLQRLKVDEL